MAWWLAWWLAGGPDVDVDLVAQLLVVACLVVHVDRADLMTWLAVAGWTTAGWWTCGAGGLRSVAGLDTVSAPPACRPGGGPDVDLVEVVPPSQAPAG